MNEKKWNPPEEKIAALLERDKRALAIGYLRASRRARQAEGVVKAIVELDAAADKLRSGDGKGTIDKLDAVHRVFNQMKQHGDL